MSIVDFADHEVITGDFEVGGADFEPFPHKTSLLAIIDEAKWANDREGNQHISLRWSVISPDDYKNRKVFQKLWVTDDKPLNKDPAKKRDKDQRMFAAIDFNCGGTLVAARKDPTDDGMSRALMNKPMTILINLYEGVGDDGKPFAINYIAAVSGRGKSAAPAAAKPAPKAAPTRMVVEDDDAPF